MESPIKVLSEHFRGLWCYPITHSQRQVVGNWVPAYFHGIRDSSFNSVNRKIKSPCYSRRIKLHKTGEVNNSEYKAMVVNQKIYYNKEVSDNEIPSLTFMVILYNSVHGDTLLWVTWSRIKQPINLIRSLQANFIYSHLSWEDRWVRLLWEQSHWKGTWSSLLPWPLWADRHCLLYLCRIWLGLGSTAVFAGCTQDFFYLQLLFH